EWHYTLGGLLLEPTTQMACSHSPGARGRFMLLPAHTIIVACQAPTHPQPPQHRRGRSETRRQGDKENRVVGFCLLVSLCDFSVSWWKVTRRTRRPRRKSPRT